MQQKDVIYIDVEDDITAIIGKVKDATQKIVALVPPKRTGVLQSAVNLKLLARAAESTNKRLVIITSNAALSGLAANAEIPVAKNLHSRPEIAVLPKTANDDDDDMINGDDVPVTDSTKAAASKSDDDVSDDTINDLNIDGEAAAITSKPKPVKDSPKRSIKVPDFGSFRKRLAIGGGIGALVIAFLIWAIWFAPHATIVVTAKTTGQSLSLPITIGTDLTTDSKQAHIKSIEQTLKDTQSVEFDATGKKNIGEKATGTVKFTQQSLSPATIPSGTKLTAGDGMVFVTNSGVTVPASSFGPGCFPTACPGTATVNVTANEAGASYNGENGGLGGTPSGMSAAFSAATAGGTDKIATVVTQGDIDKAKDQLAEANKDEAVKKLKAKFDKDDVVIESSLANTGGTPASSPAVGEEATGKAKLTSEVTYTMSAVAKGEMAEYLDTAFGELLTNKDSQRIYDNGARTVNFSDYKTGDPNDTVTLTATAQIGPKINDDQIKDQIKGKRVGEIIGDIKAIDGVSDVDVKLSPFWVQSVPGDVKKITVEFKLIEKND